MPEQLHIFCPDCLAHTTIEPGNPAQKKIACNACGAELIPADPSDFTSDKLQRFMPDAALPLLVYFHAPGCTPCAMMTPLIDKLTRKLRGKVCCAKIDARQKCELAAAYGVSSVPTVILFKSGREAKRFSGAMDIKSMTSWIME